MGSKKVEDTKWNKIKGMRNKIRNKETIKQNIGKLLEEVGGWNIEGMKNIITFSKNVILFVN